MKFFYKTILIIVGILVVLGLFANYILTYQAKELLQKAVSSVSNDTYRLEAKAVTFFYTDAGLRAEKVRLIPVANGQKQAVLLLDKIEIRLQSFWQLLVNRKLQVKTLELIKPDLVTYAKKQSGAAKKGIAETLDEIQLKLFEIIDELKVENVLISDASLKIFSADTAGSSFLSVNHLTLNLNHIEILPSTNAKTPKIRMDGNLTLLNPDIHLLDSNILVKVGKFKADILTASLGIDELDFSISAAGNRKQQLKLSTIRINRINWNRYLKEGIIELDSVEVSKGITRINLASKPNQSSKDTLAQPAVYQGANILIHHTLISNVNYQLNKEESLIGNDKNIVLNVQGDSLYLQDFSLVNGRIPAVDVEKLRIALRDLERRDYKDRMRFSLGALAIDSNSLMLKNYLLETNASDKNKNYLRIAIPEFRLENYSLEEIFQKRVAATAISLVNPDITFDIRQEKKRDSTKKKKLDAIFANLMQSVSSKVKLEQIAIENGNLTFLPTLSPEDKINVTGLSVILDAAKFPEIRDAHDFINAIRELDSKGFVLKGKNMNLAIHDMKLLKVPRGLYFGSVKGNFGDGKYIDLHGVTVLINDSISNYRRTSDFHASAIRVDSGTVSLELIKKDGKQKQGGNSLSLLVDTLNLENVVFSLQKGKNTGFSAALDVAARDLVFRDKNLFWTSLGVVAAHPDAAFGETHFNAGSLSMSQPGTIQIRNAKGSKATQLSKIDFFTESLKITLGLYSTDLPSLKVDDVELTRPELKIAIRKAEKANHAAALPGKAITKDISLKRLLLTEPTVDLTITDTAGNQVNEHKVYTGAFTLENIHTLNEPEIYVGSLVYKTTDPKSDIGGLKINPSALQLSLSRIRYNTISKSFNMHVDTVRVDKIEHTIFGKKQDTLHLQAGATGLGNFDYARGDSLTLDHFLYHTNWWLKDGNIQYHTPEKSIAAWKINGSGRQSVSITLDSFAILNTLSRDSVWASTPYEKGYNTITGGKLSVADIHLQMADKKPLVQIGKITSNNIHFTTSKDKTKTEDTITYRPLLTQMFTRMPLQLKMDSLLLNNAQVDAHEISKKTGKETHIFFTELNGYVKNVKTWDIIEQDTLEMRVRARFFGTDQLRLHFKQSYDDTLQGFWMRVRMSHFNMPEMDKLLTPLMGLQIESGTIDSLLLVANGNDYFAYGTMDLRYHDLHAKLLKTEETKGKLLISIENFFAGLLLRKHDNGRTNLLFKERLRKRSIFNFWAKIGLEGLLTNLGVKRDKKERKQFEKTIEKFKLPEKYWDDIDDL